MFLRRLRTYSTKCNRHCYSTFNSSSSGRDSYSVSVATSNHLKKWLKIYEDFIGLTSVKQAQIHVIKAEADFLEVQEERRNKQQTLSSVHSRLKKLNAELEKIPRTDDRYLQLLTEEHAVIKEEQILGSQVEQLESKERQQFTLLSTALRDSHKKESAQAERTKYWSVAGSLLGACIGIIGTTLNNRIRMRELRDLVSSKQTTPEVVTEKLDSIESSVDRISERILEQSGDTELLLNSNNNNTDDVRDIQPIVHRIDELERQLIKTAVCGLITITLLLIFSKFS